MTPPTRFIQRSWWSRRAPRPARAGYAKGSPRTVCSARSKLTPAATFSNPGGRRPGIEDNTDPVRAGVEATRRRRCRGLFTAGARPVETGVFDASGPVAKGVGSGSDHHGRGREIPAHNKRFAVAEKQPKSALVIARSGAR